MTEPPNAHDRQDLYTAIHKALRFGMFEALRVVGAVDVRDEEALDRELTRLRFLLAILRDHAEHEDAFIHPAMERVDKGSADVVASEHARHRAEIDELGQAAELLRRTPLAERPAACRRLYQRLALFVAESLEHMHVEETAHNAVLWARLDDAALAGIRARIVAAVAPEQLAVLREWFARTLGPQDLEALQTAAA